MKQLFLTTLLVGGALFSAQAQSGYEDDIYSDRPAAPSTSRSAGATSDDDGDGGNYGNNGYSNSSGGSYARSYADDYDYIDYADDYTYATRFRRFDAPFYNVGYWSGFWMPWGYDPFWGSPWYGGYNYGGWGRPGVYVSVNIGGPYWSSGWGYNTWYGYGGFSSYWGYPHYGGWGGYGGGYGWGYRNGYWDGYYAGLYGSGYGTPYAYRRINYAPRATVGGINGPGFRGVNSGYRGVATDNNGLRAVPNDRRGMEMRSATDNGVIRNNTGRAVRTRGDMGNSTDVRSENPVRNNGIENPQPARSTTGRGGFFSENNDRAVEVSPRSNDNRAVEAAPRNPRGFFGNSDNRAVQATPEAPVRSNSGRGGFFGNSTDRAAEAPVRENTRPRGGFFGNSDRVVEQQAPVRNEGWQNQRATPNRNFGAPQQQIERREMPRFEQRAVEAPRPQPRFESPRMSAPSGGFSAPARSVPSGGGGFGGGRGGAGGGLRR